MSEPGPELAQPKRRFFPRFSLRTLTLCVLLFASSFGLWWKWEPWVVRWSSETGLGEYPWVEFSPDGKGIHTFEDGAPVFRNAKDGRVRFRISEEKMYATNTRYSPDGKLIYENNTSAPRRIRLWHTEDGSDAGSVELPHIAYVACVSKDIVYLVSDEEEGDQVLWRIQALELRTGRKLFDETAVQQAFDREYRNWARLTLDRQIEIFRLSDFQRTARFPMPEGGGYVYALLPHNHRMLIASEADGKLFVLDSDTGKTICMLELPGRRNLTADFPADGSLVIEQSFDLARYNIFDTETGKALWSTNDSPTRSYRFACSADGQYMVVTEVETEGSTDTKTYIVQGRTGKRVAELKPDEGEYTSLWFSPSDLAVLAKERNGTLTMWERRRPEQWWGLAWLPEFWLTVVFALLTLWSLVRDFKTLRRANRGGASCV